MREHRLVKSRAGYLALAVSCDGEREASGSAGRRPRTARSSSARSHRQTPPPNV